MSFEKFRMGPIVFQDRGYVIREVFDFTVTPEKISGYVVVGERSSEMVIYSAYREAREFLADLLPANE